MRKLIASLILACCVLPVLAQDSPTFSLSYEKAVASAAKAKCPLVVFVGKDTYTPEPDGSVRINARFVDGAPNISTNAKSLKGYPVSCIVVAVPDGNGWMQWKATLSATATDAEIVRAMKR